MPQNAANRLLVYEAVVSMTAHQEHRLEQTFRERLPAAEIFEQVASVWMQKVASGSLAYVHRSVPNGSAELAYDLGSDIVRLIGPRSCPGIQHTPPGTTTVGVRFRPGAAPSVLGVPASELVDLDVELDVLWGSRAADLAERLQEAGSAEAAQGVLERKVVAQSLAAPAPDSLVVAAVGQLQPWRRHRAADAAAGLFISTRQMRRRFAAALGLGPKTVQRILRFQGFLALGHTSSPEVPLARLALATGYADQAHLTRESSRLAGVSPGVLLGELRETCRAHDHRASFDWLRDALLHAAAR
jgi:AraC-like DNA-binding protein